MKGKALDRITGSDYISYLRVSSKGQVNTDYNPEGISIPAQRVKVRERGVELGSPEAEEFIDPGRSAKTIDQRPEFQAMMTYLREHTNVRYVIVYALSRFARNRLDDAIMMAALEKLGVQLISATEKNIDDTSAGRMLHGMLAVFNEYQVTQSGEDIKYKMGQKAKNGGTISVAKFGYKNVRVKYEGREIRTVEIDAEFGPYVKMGFELYATGQYSFIELRDALTDAGLLMRGDSRYGRRPISVHKIGDMLKDRYYLGIVTYDGIEYPGRHDPLIEPELFERVQKVLYSERGAGTRQRHHDHFLKGTVWCDRCKRRLILRPSTGKKGRVYFYYICRGVQEHVCDLPALPVWKVERAVAAHYVHAELPADKRTALATLALEAAQDGKETGAELRAQLTRRLAELDKQEDRYLDLIGDPEWPQDKLKARLQATRTDMAKLRRQLEDTGSELDTGRDVILTGLQLLEHPEELYRQLSQRAQKVLNQAMFSRLYVDFLEAPYVASDELTEPFTTILYARRDTSLTDVVDAVLAQQNGTLRVEDAVLDETLADLLDSSLVGQSASRAAMVDLRGFEPLTPSMRTRCATRLRYRPVERVEVTTGNVQPRNPLLRVPGLHGGSVVTHRVVAEGLRGDELRQPLEAWRRSGASCA